MTTTTTFRFKAGSSTKGFTTKAEAVSAMSEDNLFTTRMVTVSEYYRLATEGHTLCHCFTDKNLFGATEKTCEGFRQTNCLFIDVDESPCAMADFIARLGIRPQIGYHTFSNGDGGKEKFRLIYVLDEPMTSVAEYAGYYVGLVERMEKDLGHRFVGKELDRCTMSPAQCIFGTRDADGYLSEDVLCKADMPFVKVRLEEDPVDGDERNIHRLTRCAACFKFDKSVSRDFFRMSLGDFVAKYDSLLPKRRFRCPYGTYNDFLHCTVISGSCVWAEYRDVAFDFNDGQMHKLTEGRGKACYNAAKMFETIYGKGNISPEQMLVLLAEYADRNFVTSTWHPKGYANWKCRLLSCAVNVVKGECLARLQPCKVRKTGYQQKFHLKVDKNWCRLMGIDPQAYAKEAAMKYEILEVFSNWDWDLTAKQNVALLKEHGMRICESKISRWNTMYHDRLEECLEFLNNAKKDEFSGTVSKEERAEIAKLVNKCVKRAQNAVTNALEDSRGISSHSGGQDNVRRLMGGEFLADILHLERPEHFAYYRKCVKLALAVDTETDAMRDFIENEFLPNRCGWADYIRVMSGGDGSYIVADYPLKGGFGRFMTAFEEYMSWRPSLRYSWDARRTDTKYCRQVNYNIKVKLNDKTDLGFFTDALLYAHMKARVRLTTKVNSACSIHGNTER